MIQRIGSVSGNTEILALMRERLSKNPVAVQCSGQRCMAYRDDEGKLRNLWNKELLPLSARILESDK